MRPHLWQLRRTWPSHPGTHVVARGTKSVGSLFPHLFTPSQPADLRLREVLQIRRKLLWYVPTHLVSIVGVSFEGRQEAVQKLQPGQAVLLLPEPSNTYDPWAVSVLTLEGTPLGYIGRAENQQFFLNGASIAKVRSMGPTLTTDEPQQQLFGASLRVQPALLHLLPLPLPCLPPDVAQSLKDICARGSPPAEVAMAEAREACEVTGMLDEVDHPLKVVPLWQVDYQGRGASVLRLAAVCPEVAEAQELFHLPQGTAQRTKAGKFIAQVNGWSPAELAQFEHMGDILQQTADLESQQWSFLLKTPVPQVVPQAAHPAEPKLGDQNDISAVAQQESPK
mmetsp:Transcript_12248/g.21682  ORF Transcript_12248/g.21682 Transcript_12248/m.21682 type:complete len:337 (+) Transcript_12248:51-1061(+)